MQFTPWKAAATLDSIQNKRCPCFTDGEGLEDSQFFRRRFRQCSVYSVCCQGQAGIGDSGGWVYSLRLRISAQSGSAVLLLKI